MIVRVSIVEGAVQKSHQTAPQRPAGGATGASLTFSGIAREMEDDRRLKGLSYEVYQPMAQQQLERIARDIGAKHAIQTLSVVHSQGFVGVGEPSLWIQINSAHRAEALLAMGEFIDALKRDVPIWKSPVFADEPTGD